MVNKSILYQHWIHSHEEDTENEIVFRLEGYVFPPRRGGRDAIDLKRDHSFIHRSSSADDRYQRAEGSWDLLSNDVLSFDPSPVMGKSKLRILSLTADRLVVSKYIVGEGA